MTTTGFAEHGSQAERLRRQLNSAFLSGATNKLLRSAGIAPGMRVVLAGRDSGDMCLQLAWMVGPGGSVLAVNSDDTEMGTAERRVGAAGLRNVSFRREVLSDISAPWPADAIVGRQVLRRQDNPVAALRGLSALVAPGGILSLQDFNVSRTRSVPALPLVEDCVKWIVAGLQGAGCDPDAGERLFADFTEAGLPVPEMSVQVPASRSGDAFEYLAAMAVASLVSAGDARAPVPDSDPAGLAAALCADARAVDAYLVMPELASVTVRLPTSAHS
jgi:hypothetical protein